MKYSIILLRLFFGFLIFGCGQTYYSDSILPHQTTLVPTDYPLYDGQLISFIEPDTILLNPPTSLSGRSVYSYQELSGLIARVEGEYHLQNGRFFLLRLENDSILKIPSNDFLKVVTFIE